MEISRRKFLGVASGSAATLLPFGMFHWNATGRGTDRRFGCALFEPPHCVLRESLQGYQAVLDGERRYISVGSVESQRDVRWVIVPSLGPVDETIAQALSGCLQEGAGLILESAGGFLSATEFDAHQKMLRDYFDVAIEPPVDCWKGDAYQHGGAPYVSYDWPYATMVRDFSRLVPVAGSSEEVIGKVGGVPAAIRKRVGNGTVVFLGSPLGPVLYGGDREALLWLETVTSL